MNYTIRKMKQSDIEAIAETFAHWNKTPEQYERYFAENQSGERATFVAVAGERVIGYTNILWQSDYMPFIKKDIPEINDLNVVEDFQNRGVGRSLIRAAELEIAEAGKPTVGIGVGQTPDYSAAQHLYPKLGYIPDGRGARPTQYGDVVYFTKSL